METTDRGDFGGKPSNWRWGRVLSWKIPEFCSVGGTRSQNRIFAFLRYPSTILHTSYRKQFYPKPMVPMESRDSLKVCLLLLWRVCDQAFGRYRPLKGCRKVVTWPSRKLKICIQSHVEWFTDCKNAILFDLRRKITKSSRKTDSEPWCHQALVDAWLSWIDARR